MILELFKTQNNTDHVCICIYIVEGIAFYLITVQFINEEYYDISENVMILLAHTFVA